MMRYTWCTPCQRGYLSFFFFNDTATPEIYTLSLHDALPISPDFNKEVVYKIKGANRNLQYDEHTSRSRNWYLEARSEEHTSELQSRQYLVCRLLLEKKKKPQRAICIESVPHLSGVSAGCGHV